MIQSPGFELPLTTDAFDALFPFYFRMENNK